LIFRKSITPKFKVKNTSRRAVRLCQSCSYIRHRDNYCCQNPNCKKQSKGSCSPSSSWFWQADRSNRPGNLITLCSCCHTPANHKQGKFLHGWQPKVKSFKPETFMSTIYRRLVDTLGCEQAFGYETKFNREQLNYPRATVNDAFILLVVHIRPQRLKP